MHDRVRGGSQDGLGRSNRVARTSICHAACDMADTKILRWPFAPLLDHRMLTSRSNYKPPNLTGCRVKTVAGRYDFLVPMHCSRNPNVQEIMLTNHTHNSLLLSSSIAEDCCEWISRP